LAHPIMPFITEEIWQRVAPLAGKNGATIMLQPYPVPQPDKIDQSAVAEMDWVMNFILGVRSIRSGMNIAPAKTLPVLLQNGSEQDRAWLDNNRPYLTTLARLEHITWLESAVTAPESATALVGAMKVLIPLAGLIDKQAELTRLNQEIEKVRKDLSRSESKLANPDYVSRAPAAVVEEEQRRITDFTTTLEKLVEQQVRMQDL
ncbi:MAG: class I tRNA ligase family protein, partial [Gammaproteobacteria bacterium]